MNSLQKVTLVFITAVLFLSLVQNLAGATQESKVPKLTIPDSSHKQLITTTDGSSNLGRIIEIRDNDIRFETDFGILTIPVIQIEKIEEIALESIKEGKVWFPNPNKSRMFFAPSARMLNKGEGYFADYYLFFPSVSYGITDNFTFGGGISIFPGISLDKQLLFITPKVGIKKSKNFNLAAGLLFIKVPGFEDNEDNEDDEDYDDDDDYDDENDVNSVGIAYSVATFGDRDANVTAGLGFGFVNNEFADKPVILLGGEKRVSRRIALVTENWIIPEIDQPMSIYGLRFMGQKMSADLGFVYVFNEDLPFPGIPYIDFMVIF